MKEVCSLGLWLEPEMISVDSDLYRKHPDWAIQFQDMIILTLEINWYLILLIPTGNRIFEKYFR